MSHKTVWALEIAGVTGTMISFVDLRYSPRSVDEKLFSRYTPTKGDFWVQYADGYESFSPRKAFLEGYTPVGQVTQADVERIARVCHEVNRAYCQAIGDNSQLTWADAPDWQRQSAITGVKHTLANPNSGPESSHESWLEEKRRDGWKYGPVKNPETKEHPCFVPYAELPVEQRAKDYLFQAVVRTVIEAA
ncbi:RyR domain-containing protein [Bradyrhizobium sp. PMVTL-01]|uniref:RyR domain-containing protein n=1 Tax=Bradyrhizobium sp. PMVTL-01 TaxID=3434999 RepID=UPI003F70B06A